MFAVVSYQGNQYTLEPNQEVVIDLVAPEEFKDNKITFSEVLLIFDDKKTVIGQPTVAGASVEAEKVEDFNDKKVRVFKFHAKKRYKRTLGHRQSYTKVKILGIKHNEK